MSKYLEYLAVIVLVVALPIAGMLVANAFKIDLGNTVKEEDNE